MTIKQGSIYSAKHALTIGRCKPKAGDLFWVTTSTHTNAEFLKIQRKGKGTIGTGYLISLQQLQEFFNLVEA